MLVADVAAGNALVTTEKKFPDSWTPPPGIHSVVGEVRKVVRWASYIAVRIVVR